ncbi:MAG: glycine--tRNA ligase subunit beta [Buchnera aphidicola (Kaburagia rhusicola ensigallis)]
MNTTFLIEIGTEELPPKSLRTMAESFKNNMIILLIKNHIKYDEISWYATPRRIAIKIEKLNITPRKKKYKGPSISNAFDSLGCPTHSTQCWIKKLGIKINQVSRVKEKKREWLFYEHFINNFQIEEKLVEISISSIKNITIPSFMKWNENNIQFSRPIRNIVMLLNNKIVKQKLLGIQTNRLLSGHMFMKNTKIKIFHAKEYPEILLQSGKVIADYNIRKTKIKNESQKIVNLAGGYLKINDFLLEEITSLVEWPTILIASFEEKFLNIPNEILIYIMENQQKYFSIYDINSNKLTNKFIIISNIETKNPQNIILGNEKVLNTRFSDAEFFFHKDQKIPFNEYQPLLKNIIFQHSLGTLHDKTNRIKKLIAWITQFTRANINNCIQAANLCKCDLVTDMVFEFPEMQGIIGMYYALYNNELENVAIAIKEHYLPRFSNDIIPSDPTSYSLALSDKTDTLVGLFIIGKNSTAKDKDPFSLRRLTIAIIRIILEKTISIDLVLLLKKSLKTYSNIKNDKVILNNIIRFILERIYFIYVKKNYAPAIIKSVLKCNITHPIDIDLRIKAITNMYNSNTLKSLILMHKRISKILILSQEILHTSINYELIQETEEKIIISLYKCIYKKIQYFLLKKDYNSILEELYNLYEPICNFFKKIKIHDKNISIKKNRLVILKKIHMLFFTTADFSLLY